MPVPSGMVIVSSRAPVSGSMRRRSLSSPSHVPCQSSPSTQVTPVTRRVVSIERNLDEALPVEELAELSGLSRSHFTRVFTAAEGLPPAEYVLRRRLERAAGLLTRAGHLSVKEIAGLAGFADPNYFAKVFRRHFGASPTEFRTTGMYAGQGRGDGGR